MLTVLFPVFASYKALRTSDPAQLSPWLMYWVSYGLFTVFENYTYWLLGWVPLYGTVRLILLLYLMLPQTQGARLAYQTYIHPFLAHNEKNIEDIISDVHAKLQSFGLDYLTQFIELLKRNVLGMQGTTPQQQQQVNTAGNYAQNLLSRFNLPNAREGMAAPAGDFYGLLSSATSILGGKTASSPAHQVDELSRSGNLIPSHIRTPSEKQRFVNQQREKLSVLMQALDRESEDSERLSRNRSEVSFDRIEEDEATEGARREGKAGWFGWAKDVAAEQARSSGLAYGDGDVRPR